ncbi:uncharacterized protein BT62DRAFT_375554 [Guyanagaster necrorhizus]|uniref:Uncharacterized protein n=1 Tax=Guyanagaster necrorhizus TaxID=856835 RepID=A0A9P8AQ71_9AGAR|nr:uncharacterized protein BT62DRAFT_375554 [Guyanagaster necrorhizus MCA 3950]KAG7442567.1 hypothetical protein BT62DRAFT_375554 [Guyanagaster necrorhizus MCA 3950]
MGLKACTTTSVPGTSSKGRACNTRAGVATAGVSLTDSGEYPLLLRHGGKAKGEIASEEVLPTQDGGGQMQPTAMARPGPSTTTTAKKHGNKRPKEVSSVIQLRRSTSYKMGRTAPGTATSMGASSNGRTRSTRAGVVTARVNLTGSGCGRESPNSSRDADKAEKEIFPGCSEGPRTQDGGDRVQSIDSDRRPSPSTKTTAKKRDGKRSNGKPAFAEESSVSTPKKRSRGGPTSPAKRRKLDVPMPVKLGEEANALTKATSQGDSPKTPKRRGKSSKGNKGMVDSSIPASPVISNFSSFPYFDFNNRTAESFSIGLPSPFLEVLSRNTPSLWASNKADLMIWTSKTNTITVFVDQESAIGITIQDDGEVELSIARSQSIAIDSLDALDGSTARENTSATDLVYPYPYAAERGFKIPAIPISNTPSSFKPDSVNTTLRPSSTEAVEISSSPGSPTRELPPACHPQASGLVSRPRDLTPPSLPMSSSNLSPSSSGRPTPCVYTPPPVAIRDETMFNSQQSHFPFGSDQAPLPSIPPPRSRHWDSKLDTYLRKTFAQVARLPLRHNRCWDSKCDNHPPETFTHRSRSPPPHNRRRDSKLDDDRRETCSGRPSYPSPDKDSPLPSVQRHPRYEPISDPPPVSVVPLRTQMDPERRSPGHRSLRAFYPPPVVNHQAPGTERRPQVSASRPSKSGLPSFKKIRSAESNTLPPLSTNRPSSPLLPDLCTHKPRSIQASATDDYVQSSSSLPSTSARRHFYMYNQPDLPHGRTESSSSVYSERLGLYSSKNGTLSSYMEKNRPFQGRKSLRPFGQTVIPSSNRLRTSFSTAAPAPIIKKEGVDGMYPFGPPPYDAQPAVPCILKRPSPLSQAPVTPPLNNHVMRPRPSSPDSLYAPLSRTHEQLQVEQTGSTDLTRHEQNISHSLQQSASEPNPSIHEPLETVSAELQQLTNNNVTRRKKGGLGSLRADVLDVVAPLANETEKIDINDLPEVQQFTDTDSPLLLFVPLPGYGYASLGYFRNLGIVSETRTGEGRGKKTMWRVRLRWVADEEYGEIEDETVARGCWWSEKRVLDVLEDKLVRDQCPGLGIGMRAAERWWCRECGRVNREDGWRWRKCLSEKCKDKLPEFLEPLSLDEVRGRNDRMPSVRPHEMASIPGIMTTTWEDGTVTYMYPLSSSRLLKHIFTCNHPPLQEDANKLWIRLQGKGVELTRCRGGPYYTCLFGENKDDWPESVKEASEIICDSAVGYGEFASGMDIQRAEVLAWFIKGSAKFKVGSVFSVRFCAPPGV